MKKKKHSSYFIWNTFLLVSTFYFSISTVIAQEYQENLLLGIPAPPVDDNALIRIKSDTAVIMDQIRYAKSFTNSWYELDLDTVSFLFHQIIPQCKTKHFSRGLMYCYRNLGWAYLLKDRADSATYYFKAANALNDVVCDDEITQYNYMDYARAMRREFKYDSAVMMFKLARDFAILRKDTNRIRSALVEMANTFRYASDMVNVAKTSFELMDLAKVRKDTGDLILAYESLNIVFSSMNMKDEDRQNLLNVQKLSNSTQKSWVKHKGYLISSRYYADNNQHDSAVYYAKLIKSLGDTSVQGLTINWNIALSYLRLNKPDSAYYYYKTWLDKAIPTGKEIPAEVYLGLGEAKMMMGEKQQALAYFKTAENNYENQELYSKRNINKSLSDCYDSLGQTALALAYYRTYKMLADSITAKINTFGVGQAFMEEKAGKDRELITSLSRERILQFGIAQTQKKQKYIVFVSSSIILFLIGISFMRYRKQREMKTNQRLLNERLRISRDLHDEVGATLSGIAMYSQLAKEQIKGSNDAEVKESLDIIQESSGDMVGKLGDIVWFINPLHDNLQNLVEKLEEYAKRMAAAKGIKVKIVSGTKLGHIILPVDSRKNIYLICKESIHNAIKYSQASEISMTVRLKDDLLDISIEDNGLGFDINTIHKGNGLNNMEKRAGELGGRFSLISAPFRGTKIEFTYNLIH